MVPTNPRVPISYGGPQIAKGWKALSAVFPFFKEKQTVLIEEGDFSPTDPPSSFLPGSRAGGLAGQGRLRKPPVPNPRRRPPAPRSPSGAQRPPGKNFPLTEGEQGELGGRAGHGAGGVALRAGAAHLSSPCPAAPPSMPRARLPPAAPEAPLCPAGRRLAGVRRAPPRPFAPRPPGWLAATPTREAGRLQERRGPAGGALPSCG